MNEKILPEPYKGESNLVYWLEKTPIELIREEIKQLSLRHEDD